MTDHAAVKKDLAHRSGQRYVLLTASGSAALLLAQRALGLQCVQVGITAITCTAVPAAVRWAGNHPVALPVDPRTFGPQLPCLQQPSPWPGAHLDTADQLQAFLPAKQDYMAPAFPKQT